MRGDCEDGNCFQTGSAQWNVAQFGRVHERSQVRALPFQFTWFRDLHPDIPGSMKDILERGCLF